MDTALNQANLEPELDETKTWERRKAILKAIHQELTLVRTAHVRIDEIISTKEQEIEALKSLADEIESDENALEEAYDNVVLSLSSERQQELLNDPKQAIR